MTSPYEHNRSFQKWMKPEAIWLGLILLFAAWLRFDGLGARSLWADEFCTWKVSQLPIGESLRWQPELTKPPLYQFVLRGITDSGEGREAPKVQQDAPYGVPDEWHLRLPAAVCGTLAVAAMWWLGSLAGGWTLGTAAGLLFAVQLLQIDYSQEARPYSMLVLGSIVSTGVWYRLATRQQANEAKRQLWFWASAYVVLTALTFHANYLMVLTVAAHAIWGAAIALEKSQISNLKLQKQSIAAPAFALLATALLCMPMVWHFLRNRTSVFQGLDWIPPATFGSTLKVLADISFGWIWVWILVVPAVVWTVRSPFGSAHQRSSDSAQDAVQSESESAETGPFASPAALCWLLLIWLTAAWTGLLLISWIAQPAMVDRYALPAAAPALLLPLVLLHQVDRRLPLMVAAAVAAATAPVWLTRAERIKPGFREMIAFLDEYADPEKEALAVAIERTTSPGWEEMDLLGFEYYGNSKFEIRNSKTTEGTKATRQQGNPDRHEGTKARRHEVAEFYLRNGKPDGDQPILREPRALWVVTFLADPLPAIESAGRRVEQIKIGDKVFEQLSFEPYRLIRVAAIPN